MRHFNRPVLSMSGSDKRYEISIAGNNDEAHCARRRPDYFHASYDEFSINSFFFVA